MDQFKSNVNIASNVYIRNPNATDDNPDTGYFEKVTGIKFLKELKNMSVTQHVSLQKFQSELLDNQIECAYARSGEKTHGLIYNKEKDKYEVVCRCEQKDCPHKDRAGCTILYRDEEELPLITKDEYDDDNIDLSWINQDEESLFQDKELEEEQKELSFIPPEDVVKIEDIAKDKHEYTTIDAAEAKECIIESGADTHILVNAAPGTGKTYTAIQRLVHLLNVVDPDEFDCILVICYTRAAVEEIKTRIESGIALGSIPAQARNVFVCTFDSLATNYLISREIDSAELSKLDYNERIQRFNEEIEASDFEHFIYCIIDEIQDLVNDRALMALNIIKVLQCGYLLLGDKCQAIYDYDCKSENNINSTEFYSRLDECMASDTEKYELTGNQRQSEALDLVSAKLRNILLNESMANIHSAFNAALDDAERFGVRVRDLRKEHFRPDEKTAILCRNNGQAEFVSQYLHKNGVPHRLIKRNDERLPLNRIICDMFWDYSEDIMTFDAFTERLMLRRGFSEDKAISCFITICEFLSEYSGTDEEKEDYIDCSKLLEAIRNYRDVPEELLVSKCDSLIVSTIHKAKGREFDKVLILDSGKITPGRGAEDNTEEDRVLYVAMTRPKKSLSILPKKDEWYLAPGDNGIWGKTTRTSKGTVICTNVTAGTGSNTDISSFAEGNLSDALRRQKYISERVNVNDKVTLILNKNELYTIEHNGTIIGRMSDQFSEDFCNLLRKIWHGSASAHLPGKVENFYVSAITSCVPHETYGNVDPVFRQKGLWLGVEITGFGSIKWRD